MKNGQLVKCKNGLCEDPACLASTRNLACYKCGGIERIITLILLFACPECIVRVDDKTVASCVGCMKQLTLANFHSLEGRNQVRAICCKESLCTLVATEILEALRVHDNASGI